MRQAASSDPHLNQNTGPEGSAVGSAAEAAWRVLQTTPSALITDIDGTISRIALTPEEAYVGEPARTALRTIAPHLALTAVITGREASVARGMVAVEGIEYVGNYALDREALLTMSGEQLAGAWAQIQPQISDMPCVEYEDKGISFSLHYRGCEDRVAARARLLEIAVPVARVSAAKIVEGKSVIELVPAVLPDKGAALHNLLRQHHIRGVVYFGDDIGDVAAFQLLSLLRDTEGLEVVTVAVVDGETHESVRTAADINVEGVDDVEEVLGMLADRLARDGEETARE